jgi:pentatricopeptide repeat protein
MEDKEIKPNDFTYNQLIIIFGNKGDLAMVEKIFQESKEKYGIKPTVITYNNLMNCYKKWI